MTLLLDILVLLVGVGLCAIAMAFFDRWLQRSKKPSKDTRYVPPRTPDLPAGGPVLHVRTNGLAVFWYEIGCPRELGTQVDVPMQSGRVGIYELRNVEPAIGVDWSWYDLEFVRYKDTPPSPKDGPSQGAK